jgi:hypothetical protein
MLLPSGCSRYTKNKFVFDKSHIATHLGEVVNKVRPQEHRILTEDGGTRLAGTQFAWLRHPANFTRAARTAVRDLRDSDLMTARAWALKVSKMALFDYVYDCHLFLFCRF